MGLEPVTMGDVQAPSPLPQAFRLMIPPLGNSINSLLKGDVASLGHLCRGDYAPQRHADAGAFPDPRSLCSRHGVLPDPYLRLDVVQRRLEKAFWSLQCCEIAANGGQGCKCRRQASRPEHERAIQERSHGNR